MPTRQQNIEIIRKACIKANPEIVELKFGCKVKVRGIESVVTIYRELQSGNVAVWYEEDGWNETMMFSKTALQEKEEVIGRPITLADVLLAIEKSHIGVRPNGMFVKIGGFQEPNTNFTIGWNLTKTLESQSDETLSFIANLLK